MLQRHIQLRLMPLLLLALLLLMVVLLLVPVTMLVLMKRQAMVTGYRLWQVGIHELGLRKVGGGRPLQQPQVTAVAVESPPLSCLPRLLSWQRG